MDLLPSSTDSEEDSEDELIEVEYDVDEFGEDEPGKQEFGDHHFGEAEGTYGEDADAFDEYTEYMNSLV